MLDDDIHRQRRRNPIQQRVDSESQLTSPPFSGKTRFAMSATVLSFVSSPASQSLSHCSSKITNFTLLGFNPNRSCRRFNSNAKSLNQLIFRLPFGSLNRSSASNGFKRFYPVMEWQDCTVKTEVDVPASVAYNCYSDREAIPHWMPFISSVKTLPDKPDQSRWSLKYKAFGRDIEFSWLARNMQPIPNQKIHWRSLEGLPNRGAVRFYPKGPSSCVIELTVSYEVPQLLAPVASALQPLLEGLLLRGLERFAKFAKTY